jgi:hypothetical protein
MKNILNHDSKYNLLLFTLIFIYVFLTGLIPAESFRQEAYTIIFTLIYAVSAKVISSKGKTRFFIFAGITIAINWFSEVFEFHLVGIISAVISIVFLILIISLMVVRIAKSKKVGLLEFLEAINIYFLMGIIGSILFRIVYSFLPGESFNIPSEKLEPTTDFIYFSFVTISTTGYGDITPIDPVAKSLSIFLSISGQLYLTMIIAVLVGKYLSAKR